MLAYEVNEWNTPFIAINCDGNVPEKKEDVTYVVLDPPFGQTRIVDEKTFKEEYIIRMPINEAMGRYLIDEK